SRPISSSSILARPSATASLLRLSLHDALPIFRPLRSLPPASSPPRLTATQLPLASDSGRHGSQRTSTSNISAMPGAPHQIESLREPDLARYALASGSLPCRWTFPQLEFRDRWGAPRGAEKRFRR